MPGYELEAEEVARLLQHLYAVNAREKLFCLLCPVRPHTMIQIEKSCTCMTSYSYVTGGRATFFALIGRVEWNFFSTLTILSHYRKRSTEVAL
jgi:hypothetical protein